MHIDLSLFHGGLTSCTPRHNRALNALQERPVNASIHMQQVDPDAGKEGEAKLSLVLKAGCVA
jgi:hypothetical protein